MTLINLNKYHEILFSNEIELVFSTHMETWINNKF